MVAWLGNAPLHAQSDPDVEPPLETSVKVTSPYDEQFRFGTSFSMAVTNFGVGLGVQFDRMINTTTTISLNITGKSLRDPSEQTFTTLFGQQFIPNKLNRVLTFPIMLGYKKRIFTEELSDNFRLNLSSNLGPSLAFVYPYFNDTNGDQVFQPQSEFLNDIFQGWDLGEWKYGVSGEFGLGVDFGDDMKMISSVYFGAYLFYFPDAIQIMEPFSYNESGILIRDQDAQSLFVSPVIRLVFGKYKGKGNRPE